MTSQRLYKANQFRKLTNDINKELEEEFFDHKRFEYKKAIKQFVLSANRQRRTHLTVLKREDGTFCVKFLPATELMQIFKVGDLKFTVIDFKSDNKQLVYFKKCIKYRVKFRDVKEFTLEQHKKFAEMSYKAYVDWLKPIVEAGGYKMVIDHNPKCFKNKEIKKKIDEGMKPKYIVKSRL
ncbi:hypothetical protein C1645_792629 [Glomus cerebriforme]|uniref:Uncharacterized protein n=1 Tax=Glomus cerebriforme TaxID=658196 RepID=A0A397S348_9GLOM|nr:hypothetical protein C1645_792629 [Glomus cerebriforme]